MFWRNVLNRLMLLALAGCIGLSACSKKEEVAAAVAPNAIAPSTNNAMAPASINAAAPNSGKVLQIQQAGPYTYAEVEVSGGQKVWIAGGPIAAKPGDTVQWGDYAVMQNFHSKSLNRDFAEILFVNAWGPAGGMTAQVAPHGAPVGHPAAQDQAAATGANQGSVKSVMAAAGYSYLEIEQNGSTIWVAAPETPAKVGDKVRWGQGSVMRNFASKSLGRTFESIIFTGQVEVLR